jgi:hypothetical protein
VKLRREARAHELTRLLVVEHVGKADVRTRRDGHAIRAVGGAPTQHDVEPRATLSVERPGKG